MGVVVFLLILFFVLIVLGILVYVFFVWLREESFIKFFKVERMDFFEGVEVYIDENSMMVFKNGRMFFIGGVVFKEFFCFREFVECILKVLNLSLGMKFVILIVGFFLVMFFFFVLRGVFVIVVYGIVVLMIFLLFGKVVVSRMNKRFFEECCEVLKEYLDFIRKKKGKFDIVID